MSNYDAYRNSNDYLMTVNKFDRRFEHARRLEVHGRGHDDPNDLEFWQKEPEGLIIVNYCTEAECDAILAAGKVDLSGDKEGFMAKLPVGN